MSSIITFRMTLWITLWIFLMNFNFFISKVKCLMSKSTLFLSKPPTPYSHMYLKCPISIVKNSWQLPLFELDSKAALTCLLLLLPFYFASPSPSFSKVNLSTKSIKPVVLKTRCFTQLLSETFLIKSIIHCPSFAYF